MTISLNRAFLLLLLTSGVAFAQPQAPHDTGAVGADMPAHAPASVTTMDSDEDEQQPPSITTAPVGAPTIEGFGILEQSNGGLSPAVWKGSTRDSAGPLLGYFHTGIANDTVRDLTVRLLTTQAAPPQGSGENWFLLRVSVLAAIGEDAKATQMIDSLPISMVSEPLAQMRAALALNRGDADNACKSAASPTENHEGSAFWQKLTILCQARAGKQEEVGVGLDMLLEQSQQGDLFFQDVIHKIQDKSWTIKSWPKEWSLFNVSILRLAGEGDKLKDKFDAIPPVALKYLAQDTSLDIKLREKATAKAQQLGVLPVPAANKTAEQPFERSLASDVTTLVAALQSGKPADSGDEAVISRLALDEGVGIQDSRRVERLLTLMEPFGYTVPSEVWHKLFAHKNRFDGEVPSAMLVSKLADAAQADRKGEVILLAALIVGGSDTDRISDLALLPVVKALKSAGFEKEARDVATSAVKNYSVR